MRTMQELTECYARHRKTVWNICYSYLMNPADTEDAVQDTFLRYIESSRRFADENHEKAWLIVTARNVCKDELKRARRKNIPLERAGELSAAADEKTELLSAIQALPDQQKTAVYLHYYEGCSCAEIAAMLRRRESTVRSDLRRARLTLKARIGGKNDEG